MTHPSNLIPGDIINYLRKFSALAESQGKLCEEQLHIISRKKWFDLFVPAKYEGLNLSLPEAVRLEEALAWVDGNIGWVVTLCAGAGLFVGYLEPELADEIFSNDNCLAGSGQANGAAEIIEGGYEVNGEWPYASGAAHATYFTANCVITENGVPVLKEDNQPLIRSFIFRRYEVKTQPNWRYIGLNGTSGYSYTVKNLKVPANRAFIIHPSNAKLNDPIYKYPFLQLAETTIAANMCGMSIYFLELAQQIINKKERGKKLLARALNEVDNIRKEFYNALDESWSQHLAENNISDVLLERVSVSSRNLAQQSRKLVCEIYPYCGLEGARTESVINLVWRNIHTASQHILLLGPDV